MVRLLVLIAVLFAFAAGFAWLSDHPGLLTITWMQEEIQVPLLFAVIVLLAVFVALMIVWSVVRSLLRSPDMLRRFFGRRRRDKGYRALSSALIALGSGDSAAARRFAREAGKHLDGAPVTRFIEAQVAQQEDRASDARTIYEELTLYDHTRLLGLHGLFLEARHEGETEVARHYAEQAVAIAPHLPWAGQALFELQCADGDWEAALATLDRNLHAKLVERRQARRLRAVLLTAQAMQLEDGEPERARKLAAEAHGLCPELVPAAGLAGRLHARLGDIGKAAKALEATWKKQPHPEIAEAYAHVRPGDSVQDRLKRIEKLAELRPNAPEGAIALARAAMDAGEWERAREAMKRVLRANPTQQACLMMAELEEAESGDRGRVREWLARAVHAPRDPAWTADGVVSDEWAPVSPVTGRLDAFEWKVPVEELEDRRRVTVEDALLEALPPPPPPELEPEDATVIDAAHAAKDEAPHPEQEASEPAGGQTQDETEPQAAEPEEARPQSAAAREPIAAEAHEEPAAATADEAAQGDEAEAEPDGYRKEPLEFPFPHPPDDPGPKPRDDEGEKKRFRLFS